MKSEIEKEEYFFCYFSLSGKIQFFNLFFAQVQLIKKQNNDRSCLNTYMLDYYKVKSTENIINTDILPLLAISLYYHIKNMY